MTAPNELSFLPDDYLEQKWKRRANLVCAVLALLTAGAVAAGWSWVRKHDVQIEGQFATVDAKYVDAARKIEQVKKMHDQQREVVHHAELAAALVEKVPRSNILAEMTNSLPPGVSLLELTMDSRPHQGPPPPVSSFDQHRAAIEGAAAPASAPMYDVHLKITGVAQNDSQVAQLITRLGHTNSNLFQDVNLIITDSFMTPGSDAARTDKGEPLRRWQIEMMLNPRAEVREDKSAAVELSK